MGKKVHFYVNCNNMEVQQKYLNVIKAALVKNGFECDDVLTLDGSNKNDLYVFSTTVVAFKFFFKGYKNFILWQQGVTADESYMRNHSKLRYHILNYIDCFVLKRAKMILFCSDYMQKHYEKLSGKSFASKCYLMPCYNEELSLESIEQKDYSKKIFTYVGSLDLWQCFDETVALYKQIEDRYPDSFFKVLTFSEKEAKEKIASAGIKNYEVKRVKKEEVSGELSDAVYGFLIRKDSIVNRVATPTKLSSYLSVGVIPIFSTVLDDFTRASKNMSYVIPLEQDFDVDTLIERLGREINKDDLISEYRALFNSYYATEKHIENISELARGLFL